MVRDHQVATNDTETMQGMAVAVEYVTRLISRYAFVESQYLGNCSTASAQLHNALVRVYTAILVYILRARRYFAQNTASEPTLLSSIGFHADKPTERALGAFRPAKLQTDDYLGEIKNLEEEVEKLTWAMSMECRLASCLPNFLLTET